MQHAFIRTEWLIGKQALEKLSRSTVAVFGIGGVGSFAVQRPWPGAEWVNWYLSIMMTSVLPI